MFSMIMHDRSVSHSIGDWNTYYFVDISDYKCCLTPLYAYGATCTFPSFPGCEERRDDRTVRFNQKLYSYKSPSRLRVPSRSIGSRILVGIDNFSITFSTIAQIRSPFVTLFRNTVPLAVESPRRPLVWRRRDAPSLVKPWTFSSSSRDDEKIAPAEIAYIKNFAWFIASSWMTITYVYKRLHFLNIFKVWKIVKRIREPWTLRKNTTLFFK